MAIFPVQKTPSIISGCRLWLDASQASTITSAGGSVSAWADMSGRKFDLSQGTGVNQPDTGVETINGLPAVGFDSNEYLLNSSWGNAQQRFTYFVVAKVASAPSTNFPTMLAVGPSTPVLGSIFSRFGASNQNDSFIYDGSSFEPGCRIPGFATNTPYVFSFAYDGSTVTATRSTSSNSQSRSITIANGVGNIIIGTPSGGPKMSVGEVIFYERFLTAAEKTAILRYLGNKWGLVV
jgi:hypothetical protein